MADEIEFTMPSDNEPAAAEPVIDIATGEPSLASGEPAAAEPVAAEPSKSTPDADAALAVAAKSSREAREFKKQLDAANAELAKLKESPVATDDFKAKYEAIKKNPSLLFQDGWDAEKLMRVILDPDAATAAVPLDKDALKKEILAEIEAARAETPEQKKAREDRSASEYEQSMVNASKFTETLIKAGAEETYWVDESDARMLAEKVTKFCVDRNIEPTRDFAISLLKQGITKLHAAREKRFGSRGIARGGQSQKPSQLNTELGFTEGSGKLRVLPQESAKPTPKVPASTGTPLPTPKPGFEIGFT